MTDEKPLHVRVAEALGCTPRPPHDGLPWWSCTCAGEVHNEPREPGLRAYDTDWSATGPLIGRFRIGLWMHPDERSTPIAYVWGSHDYTGLEDDDLNLDGHGYPACEGATPLIAFCNVILALHAAGKLPEINKPS